MEEGEKASIGYSISISVKQHNHADNIYGICHYYPQLSFLENAEDKHITRCEALRPQSSQQVFILLCL